MEEDSNDGKNRERVILYIEDEDQNRLLVKKILEKNQIRMLEAEDGLKGLELIQQEKFDLILLDINLEGMNGYEVATRIRMMEHGRSVPLVAFTANLAERARDRALISGCDGFISKPIDGVHLVLLLEEYMSGRKDCVDTSKIVEVMTKNTSELVCHLESQLKDLQRANRELKELDNLKSNFVSLISHELKTPLTPIVGYVDYLLKDKLGILPPKIEKTLRIIHRNSKRLEKLIYDIVTLDQLDRKVYFSRREIVDIVQLVKNSIEDYALIFQERELQCLFHQQGNIPKIYCNEMKLIQVVSSILNNGIKYTENKGILDIHVRYPSYNILKKYDLNPEDYLEIVFKDDGIGIPNGKLEVIFEKFVELTNIENHHSSEHEFMGGGSGIGLSISKGIIKEHKGFIWAEHRVEKGSKFYVILPISAPSEE